MECAPHDAKEVHVTYYTNIIVRVMLKVHNTAHRTHSSSLFEFIERERERQKELILKACTRVTITYTAHTIHPNNFF